VSRVAAIDCGTNSIRLLVADVPAEGAHTDLLRRMEVVRLGEGVDATGRLAPQAIERTRVALAEYATVARDLGAVDVRMVATSASRDAANRADFEDMVRATLGRLPDVIPGQEEAELSFLGATASLDAAARAHGAEPPRPPFLVVDIGGGSTEFIAGVGVTARAMVSLDIGCVRLFERHLHTDPPTAAEVAALRADVAAHLDRVGEVLDPAVAERVVGVAGTVTTVTAIALGLEAYDPRRIHLATVDAAQIAATAEKLAAMTVAERAALPVMARGREDVIAAGALLLDELVRRFQIQQVVASEADILDGVLLGSAEGTHDA
jgi:exopolyphosphatase/guanosine-5'-triphosphate,3'-diphosphate pyrophosphatase